MPSDQRALTRAARARAASSSGEETYTAARAALLAERTATATIDPVLLVPYPDEDGVGVDELGWRVLPADATPQQRAHAEAYWRPVTPDRPCRCSGPCHHGEPCQNGDDGIQSCEGYYQHVDRVPAGSLLGLLLTELTSWTDEYDCVVCGDEFDRSVTLENVPWGEIQTGAGGEARTVVIYPDVRHPSVAEDDDADGGFGYQPEYCPDCGFDTCACDREYGCPECGAGSAGDPYGECVCEPQ